MNSPTHEEIAQRAHQIWHDRGRPSDNDTAIWFEAERQLAESGEAEPVAAHLHGHAAATPSPDEMAAKAAFQKNAARAPQLQHGKNAPKPAPPESGKPVWDKPHSS